MTKKKNFISRLFFGVVALTLVSFCFLGSTFARYTSSENGTASVSVAKWDVDFTNAGGTDVTFDKLSPDDIAWNDVSTRYHPSATKELLTIINNSDVIAEITIVVGAIQITKIVPDYDTVNATEEVVKGLFSIELKTGDTWDSNTTIDGVTTYKIKLNPGNSMTITGQVTWASADDKGQVVADAIDTWVGEYVKAVSWRLTYTAVQASKLP